VWEVFEVHRTSHKAEAVSAGLERGWLAFVSESQKRRLAPFPSEWLTVDRDELERLCNKARAARPVDARSAPRAAGDAPHAWSAVPRIRPARTSREMASAAELPIVATVSAADPVERTVRTFAQQARSQRLPAVEAMVQLKGLLARVYTSANSAAHDRRAVRRWFVESFYFDPAAPARDETNQSR
jgi:hypothetical protein